MALLLSTAWTVLMLIPTAAGASGLTSFAYVTNTLADTVSVINTSTNTVVATVQVGLEPVGVAITPNGALAYVANSEENDVSVINTYTNTVVATVPVTGGAYGVAISPNGAFAYVTSYSFGGGFVSVINTSTNTVVATVPHPENSEPIGVAFTPDGAHAYVADNESSAVDVINTATNSIVATVPVGFQPEGVAITPDGAFAYVANHDGLGSSISVINTSTNTVAATVADPDTVEVAITPNGAFAYVTNDGGTQATATVSVINTSTNTIVATVHVGIEPQGVAITADGALVYAVNVDGGSVSVINTSTNTVVATIPVGTSPTEVAITPARAASPPSYILSVSLAGTGKGSVSGSGISCPGTCSRNYAGGTVVRLTAKPSAGSKFGGWSGGGCSGTRTCTVTMSASRAVTASFRLLPPGTKISKSKLKQTQHQAKFSFKAIGTPAGFQCALVKQKPHHKQSKPHFARCKSPKTYNQLKPGKYTFEVRAFNAAGADPTPAKKSFTIH